MLGVLTVHFFVFIKLMSCLLSRLATMPKNIGCVRHHARQDIHLFERNTGREAFQMYWTLLVANIFGTGLSFLSLKLGTALLGILPSIYLFAGKRIRQSTRGTLCAFPFWDRLLAERHLAHWAALSAVCALRCADAALPDPRPAYSQPKRFPAHRHFPRLGFAWVQPVPLCPAACAGCHPTFYSAHQIKRDPPAGCLVVRHHRSCFFVRLPAVVPLLA